MLFDPANLLLDIKQRNENMWKWKSLSGVQLFVIPWTIQPMEFSRPEDWSG